MPTGKRFWNELTLSDKLQVCSKALFWLPVGMFFFIFMAFIYVTTGNSTTVRDEMTVEEALDSFTTDYIAVLLFAFVASLAANVTTIKLVIKSNTVRTRGWV